MIKGAAYNAIVGDETLESLAELYCELLDENAELRGVLAAIRKYKALNPKFQTLAVEIDEALGQREVKDGN